MKVKEKTAIKEKEKNIIIDSVSILKPDKKNSKSVVVKYADDISSEAIQSRKELYESIISNAKFMGYDENGKPTLALAEIPLSLCAFDMRYQREREDKEIVKFSAIWEESYVGTILVVPHPDECRFMVIDGQKRCLTAPKIGKSRMIAIMNLMAPDKEADSRLVFESKLFLAQGNGTDVLKGFQKHKGLCIVGDEYALALQRAMEKYDFTYVTNGGQRPEAVLGSYNSTYALVRNYGEECIDFAFSVIVNAEWNQQKNGFSRAIVGALSRIFLSLLTQNGISRKMGFRVLLLEHFPEYMLLIRKIM